MKLVHNNNFNVPLLISHKKYEVNLKSLRSLPYKLTTVINEPVTNLFDGGTITNFLVYFLIRLEFECLELKK